MDDTQDLADHNMSVPDSGVPPVETIQLPLKRQRGLRNARWLPSLRIVSVVQVQMRRRRTEDPPHVLSFYALTIMGANVPNTCSLRVPRCITSAPPVRDLIHRICEVKDSARL